MFFSKKLKKFKNVRHCFFSRKNGFSKGFYQSLNCGLGSNDKKENVHKNLEFVSKKIGCKKESLITLKQVHSNQVIHFYNESSVLIFVGSKSALSKSVREFFSIMSSRIRTYCSPIDA